MSEEVLKTNIVKEPGMLYFCKSSEDGFITVNKSKAGRPAGWSKKNIEVNAIPEKVEITEDIAA